VIFVIFGVWFILLGTRIIVPNLHPHVSSINQVIENFIHIFLILLVLKIYINLSKDDKRVFKWFIVTNIFFFLNDAVFYLFVYLPGNHSHISQEIYSLGKTLLNNTPFIVWLIAIIIFLSKILIRDVMSKRLFFQILPFLIGFNLIVITLFLSPVGFKVSTGTIHNLFSVSGFIIESIIFDIAILCLVYSQNRGISLILSGFIVVITGDFLITYCWMAKIEEIYGYGSLLWFLGMILILWGVLKLTYDKSYNIKLWFRSSGSIKSKVTFWAFGISAASFLLFIIIAWLFSFINKHALIALPVFIMFYSIFVVSLSVLMGKVFEVPFKQIENNIKFMLVSHDRDKIDSDFSIDEFIFLQKVIVNAFKSKEEQDLIRRKFGDYAAEVAHDIASPLNAMSIAVSNLKKRNNVEKDDIALLERAMLSVKDITNNLLANYRNLDEGIYKDLHPDSDNNVPRHILLAPLLINLIENKRIEWTNEPCNISINLSNQSNLLWAYVAPQALSRAVSNLLNNAYESLNKKERNITVTLSQIKNFFELTIKDNGRGIPQQYLEDVLLGKSLKHPGSGMGLSGAKKFLTSINGDLKISSTYEESTTISITLPIADSPIWFSSQIVCNPKTEFIILDDEPSIIMLWQRILTRYNAKGKYFSNIRDFDIWFHTNDNNDVVYLIDYDIKDSMTGMDIIHKYNLSNVYMLTNHAEEPWLQSLARNNTFKLVPKSIINYIQIIYP
jgi:signal transduction histidine kinase